MGRIIAIANQKGGVGKTTTSVNLGAELGALGKKVLLIDLDPQGNATSSLGIDRSSLEFSTFELFDESIKIDDIMQKPEHADLDLIPATQDLSGIEKRLIEDDSRNEIQYILSSRLQSVKDRYDYLIIDCPPSLGLSTVNALMSADSILIPVQCQFLSLDGLTQLLNTIRIVQKKKKEKGLDLSIEGVLLTMLDKRSNAANDVVEEVKSYFKEKVFDAIVTMNVAAQEAPMYGMPINQYKPKSPSSKQYAELAKELVKKNG